MYLNLKERHPGLLKPSSEVLIQAKNTSFAPPLHSSEIKLPATWLLSVRPQKSYTLPVTCRLGQSLATQFPLHQACPLALSCFPSRPQLRAAPFQPSPLGLHSHLVSRGWGGSDPEASASPIPPALKPEAARLLDSSTELCLAPA